MVKNIIKKIVYNFCERIVDYAEISKKEKLLNSNRDIHPSCHLGRISIIGNATIDAFTYINEGTVISSGNNSKVIIGRHCAIGRYVHISAKTHDLEKPTSDEDNTMHGEIEKDVIIGSYVWIGDKVFIREGVSIGDYAIIAANSVVNRNVLPFEIVGGVPIKHIRFNTSHYKCDVNKEN
jgi:acetyltransferase-like isoleucine patch superfamily enzyme